VASPTTAPTAAYFPPPEGEWEKADAAKTGWSQARLDKVVTLVEETRGATFMMLQGGRILVESYFGKATASSTGDIASVQKSVTSTLIGIAREKGLLQLDDAVSTYLPVGWSRAAPADEAKITLRHLMTHSSGLSPTTLKRVADPGTVFDYNTDAYQRTRPVLEKVAGMGIDALTRAWIFDPIAASPSAAWGPRDDKDSMGVVKWGISLCARDMARFGLLSLHRGQWAGKAVINPAWYDEAWASSQVKVDYGLLWWLQGKGGLGRLGAPKDLVSALGAQDQKIYVLPSLGLVVTRQGLAAKEASEAESDFDTTLFKAILAARA
jgi:CubicO group peptidase (beta-lactamase class C family)